MKVLLINLGLFGSTGKIIKNISNVLTESGHQAYMVYPDYPQNMVGGENDFCMKVGFGNKVNALLEKVSGYQGCFSFKNTRTLIEYIKQIKPDVINLHNLHGMKINLGELFAFLKQSGIPIVWTLHDCWSFTGQCPYFTLNDCKKWRDGCYNCTRYKEYPAAYVDRTKAMWKLKRKWFTGIQNLTIATPSEWLSSLVKQSFLNEYPVKVINNGIDLSVFKPSESKFRESHNLTDKKIVLGVAFGWDRRKGVDVFIEFAKRLPGDYRIVLVGTTDKIDKLLPKNIISIHRTQNQQELAEIYSAADVFVNPTREENYPTVNMEALACGTPIITFKTGGSPEIIDETCGVVVDCDDVDTMERQTIQICTNKPFSREACLNRAKSFDNNKKIWEYIDLYERIRVK